MSTLSRARTVALVTGFSSLLGCGATATQTQAEEAPPPVAAAPTSPWDGLDTPALVARIRQDATARVAETDPSLDLSQRAAWGAAPDTAPELGDRACAQLLNLAITDLASGDLEGAEHTVRLVRQRARNRNNAFVGNTLLSIIARRRAGETDPASAIAAIFRELPRARFGASTVVFQLYQAPEQIEAALEQTHAQMVTLDTAVAVLFQNEILRDVVANRETYLAAIATVRAEHDARPAEADHAFSTVDMARARDANPVLVAVWDTGTATNLFGADQPFGNRLFTNANEQPNGLDDDNNGLVDDIHGVIADPDPAQTAYTFEPGAETITQYAPFLRGVMDLRAGMASTESAQRVLTLMRSATDAESLETLDGNLDAIGEWAHGTHVAGIILAGLPQAQLAIFRSAWAGETRVYRHRGPTDVELAAERANIENIATFINTHHVRVVNASLGFEQDYVEGELSYQSDTYATPEALRERAHAIQAHRRAEWQWVFEHCPETLFVIAAGNSNHDVVEYQDVAASISAPNVLVVGAVDRFGNWATFTNSNPEQVRLFDFGVEVDSLIPNGEHVPLSGTSMASPNAANLAAKMISVDPALTPPRVIELMTATGEAIPAPFNGVIAHEANALARVRRDRRPAGRARR